MKGNLQIFPGIAERISMTTRGKRQEKDTEEMLSVIEGRAKIIDMRKKSCMYVGLPKFKDIVRIIDFLGLFYSFLP